MKEKDKDLEEQVAAARVVLAGLNTEERARQAGLMVMFEALGADIAAAHGVTIIKEGAKNAG